MEIVLAAPNMFQARQWEGDNPLAYVFEAGMQPIRAQTDWNVDDTGKETFTPYMEHGECTVYIDNTGLLMLEYYEGPVSGNPEDGERITLFSLQCIALEAAKGMARVVLAGIEGMDADKLVALGFTKEEL